MTKKDAIEIAAYTAKRDGEDVRVTFNRYLDADLDDCYGYQPAHWEPTEHEYTVTTFKGAK